jgi:hypothetical protein
LYKSYYLGDDAPGNKGTYFKLEGGEPYVAYLRGFNGFLSPRYDVQENEWRDRLLLSCNPGQINSLKIEYTRMPAENIELNMLEKKLTLNGNQPFDTASAFEMLLSFKRVYAERFLNRFPQKQKDSLLKAGPELSFEVKSDESSCSGKFLLFYTSDPDRSLAYNPQKSEWLTIQNRNLYPIMRRRSSLVR